MNTITANHAELVRAFRAQLASLPSYVPAPAPAPAIVIADADWRFIVEIADDGSARSIFSDGSSAPYVPLEASAAVTATRELLAAA